MWMEHPTPCAKEFLASVRCYVKCVKGTQLHLWSIIKPTNLLFGEIRLDTSDLRDVPNSVI